MSYSVAIHPFPAYLWGIETCSYLVEIHLKYYFQPTYEELKLSLGKTGGRLVPISSLPMRNWNSSALITRAEGIFISSLPMRNWNGKNMACKRKKYFYFQPTYEELKLNGLICHTYLPSISSLPMRNWNQNFDVLGTCTLNFQPTYEELKLGGAWPLNGPKLYFQPTYEELKPKCYDRSVGNRRDFQPTYEELKHDKPGPGPARKCKFPAYLWGIETKQTHLSALGVGPISSLPMRNWNGRERLKTFQTNMISSLPMRNWNIEVADFFHTRPVFPAYLWGIETRYRLH